MGYAMLLLVVLLNLGVFYYTSEQNSTEKILDFEDWRFVQPKKCFHFRVSNSFGTKFPVGRSDCRWCVGKVGGDSTKFRFAPWWKLGDIDSDFWGDGRVVIDEDRSQEPLHKHNNLTNRTDISTLV